MKKAMKIVLAVMVAGVLLVAAMACSGGETKVESETGGTDSAKTENGVTVDGQVQDDLKNLKVGQKISKNGLSVAVVKISDGGKTYDGKALIKAKVSYENKSEDTASFNTFDWAVQDSSGARTNPEFTGKDSELSSGELAPGGTKEGIVYFLKKNADKVVYSGNLIFDGEEDLAMWNVK